MGDIVEWRLCTSHEEKTPSLAVYTDGTGWCFGCATHFKQLSTPIEKAPKREVTDIPKQLEYIRSLPTTQHRHLNFPSDNLGYYIIWPNGDYYKRRNWDVSTDKPKYTCPKGQTQPLYWKIVPSSSLVIIEGEINLLSLQLVIDNKIDLMSPGSAGNFKQKKLYKDLTALLKYEKIFILVDRDVAGLRAAISLKTLLQPDVYDVTIILMEKDCNQLLVEYGKEYLKTWAEENLELSL